MCPRRKNQGHNFAKMLTGESETDASPMHAPKNGAIENVEAKSLCEETPL